MYTLEITKKFKSQFKKLSKKDRDLVYFVLEKLLNGEVLDWKYKDHQLSGQYAGTKECHIKPDLLLIYKKTESILVLTCLNVGSHSELF